MSVEEQNGFIDGYGTKPIEENEVHISPRLSWPVPSTSLRAKRNEEEIELSKDKLKEAISTIISCIGEDPSREGLIKTPQRYADALLFLTRGYEDSLQEIINGALFEENHDEMVIIRDIQFHSLCEHHLLPFAGKAHIGYIPNKRVLGLSKFGRIVDLFSRRLQLQERLTKQIATAIMEVLNPQGVAVVLEATHLCMEMRGVEKCGSNTITSAMLGVFRTDPKTREEFLTLSRKM